MEWLEHRYHAQAIYISPHLPITGLNALPSIVYVRPEFLLHGISCVKKIQLLLHEGSKAALKVHKSLFFFAAHVSPEPHRASCQTVDQQCPGKQPQAPSTKLSSHFGNSNVKCNRLVVVPYSYRIWPDQFLQPPDGHRMQAMPYLADLEVFHRESKMQDFGFKEKTLHLQGPPDVGKLPVFWPTWLRHRLSKN